MLLMKMMMMEELLRVLSAKLKLTVVMLSALASQLRFTWYVEIFATNNIYRYDFMCLWNVYIVYPCSCNCSRCEKYVMMYQDEDEDGDVDGMVATSLLW